MKQFRFRYQTVLEVRERRQKAEEEALQRLLAIFYQEQAELERLVAEHAAKYAEWTEAQRSAALDLQSLVLYQGFIEGMERRVKRQRDVMEDAGARCDHQRAMLTEAMREADVMRQLRDRDYQAWQKAVDQAENALLDELATTRHARKINQDV